MAEIPEEKPEGLALSQDPPPCGLKGKLITASEHQSAHL